MPLKPMRCFMFWMSCAAFPCRSSAKKTAAVNLGVAMQALEAKSSTGSLMLNTDNHSMLVSKVVEHGETSYRFL